VLLSTDNEYVYVSTVSISSLSGGVLCPAKYSKHVSIYQCVVLSAKYSKHVSIYQCVVLSAKYSKHVSIYQCVVLSAGASYVSSSAVHAMCACLSISCAKYAISASSSALCVRTITTNASCAYHGT
jgi:hypothetical protein